MIGQRVQPQGPLRLRGSRDRRRPLNSADFGPDAAGLTGHTSCARLRCDPRQSCRHCDHSPSSAIYELETQLEQLEAEPNPTPNTEDAIRNMRVEINRMKREVYENLSPWEIVQVARHEARPQTLDYIELVFDEFVELHGDKAFGDDRAILTGFAKLDDFKVMFVGQQKGRNLEERNACNFGMAHPEGYRKALCKMQMAAKFGLPVVCFIDTAGAYPGIGAEERGQAYQIAVNLREMSPAAARRSCASSSAKGGPAVRWASASATTSPCCSSPTTPSSVPKAAPASCGSIRKYADKAAQALRFTSAGPAGVRHRRRSHPRTARRAHRDHRRMAATLKGALMAAIDKLLSRPPEGLVDRRYDRFRKLGVFEERTIES